jgi:hypothetical protein
MKPTLLLLSVIAIALIPECANAFGSPQRACEAGEMWKRCGTCDGTCDRPHVACQLNCRPGGCGCKWGYVRDERTNKCIPLESCPRKKQTFDELDDEEAGKWEKDEMDDEEDESVGRSCKDFPMADDCRRLRHKNLHAWHTRRLRLSWEEAECLRRPKTAEHPNGWLYSGMCLRPDHCCPWIDPSEFRL